MLPIRRFLLFLSALAMAGAATLAAADPPARVGRLSLVEGTVTFQVVGQEAAGPATPNWPISSGASLVTGPDGRAEVEVGANVFRLAGNTRVDFPRLDDQQIALQVQGGRLAVSVGDPQTAADIEVATPSGWAHFDGVGRYRIDVERTGDTLVSSRSGAYVRFQRNGGELLVPPGRRAVALASGGWYMDELRQDDFDAWTDARTAADSAPLSRHYVSPSMTGYEDLDRYGDWGSTDEYGAVWYPRAVPVDWAPYRFGRWAWVPPWGWTWVDEAPWGFAPFHYGRWLFVAGRWAWVPGSPAVAPVYAPALVAWIGSPGWGTSLAGGPAVGWFPLAPQEVFVPAYRCTTVYIRQVNDPHVRDHRIIQRVVADPKAATFANRSVIQAVTVVPAKLVGSGRPIAPAVLHQHDRQVLAQAPVSARAPDVHWLPPTTTARKPHGEAVSDNVRTFPVPVRETAVRPPRGENTAAAVQSLPKTANPPVSPPPKALPIQPPGTAAPAREVAAKPAAPAAAPRVGSPPVVEALPPHTIHVPPAPEVAAGQREMPPQTRPDGRRHEPEGLPPGVIRELPRHSIEAVRPAPPPGVAEIRQAPAQRQAEPPARMSPEAVREPPRHSVEVARPAPPAGVTEIHQAPVQRQAEPPVRMPPPAVVAPPMPTPPVAVPAAPVMPAPAAVPHPSAPPAAIQAPPPGQRHEGHEPRREHGGPQ